jgi:hypothetical protein
MKTKNISKYILNFIKENKNDEKITDNWKTKENLIAFEKILKKENKNKSKDANKPKRGKSSFLYFCDEYKSIIKKDFPDYTNKQIISYLGVLWKDYKENKPELIKKYEKVAGIERDRYKKEMLIYKEENTVKDEKKSKDILDNDNIDIEIKDEKKAEDKKEKEKLEDKKEKLEDKKKKEKVEEKVEERVEETKEKKDKKKEKVLDEDQKGFNKYLKKRKNKFIEEYPELNGDQLFEKMKKKWSSLSDEKKQKYKS